MKTATLEYFGKDTVERFVAAYFAKNGDDKATRDILMAIAVNSESKFLDMLCDYLDTEAVPSK